MSTKTKTEKCLAYLKKAKKKGLTNRQSVQKWDLYRLSGVIYNLRKRGYNITTEVVHEGGSEHAVYRLVE